MPYPSKINLALDVLSKTGMGPASYAPPIHRLLWSLGVLIPPPHFSSFFGNVVFKGIWFGVFLFLSILLITDRPASVLNVAVLSVLCGGMFGLISAAGTRYRARRLKLPAWSELHDVASRFD